MCICKCYGFFKYENGALVSVYDINENTYHPISAFKDKCDIYLGTMPASFQPWKIVIKDKNKTNFLSEYFNELKSINNTGAIMAKAYHKRSLEIGLQLVKEGVAQTNDDVNTVMLTGFFHAYGPINDFINA